MARPGIIYTRLEYGVRSDPYIYLDQQAIYTLRLKESGIIFNWIVDTETKRLGFVAAKIGSPDFFMIDKVGGCFAAIGGETLVSVDLDQIKIAYRKFLTS